ncbi:MAG: hypothetical protein ACREJ2_10875 [Planctomycetota bacterium]
MRRIRIALLVCWSVLCGLAGTARSAHATTFVYQSTLDLLKNSDAVVVGKVTAVRYEKRGDQIVTIVTLNVADVWKGAGLPGSVEVVEPGGILGNVVSQTGGMPAFQTGDQVVTFLQKDPNDPGGRYRTTSGVPGRYLVVDGADHVERLARPSSDADCDIAGHAANGLTAVLGFAAMMRIEGREGTSLAQFRAEVESYQRDLTAGRVPALAARDRDVATALQALFDRQGQAAAANQAAHSPGAAPSGGAAGSAGKNMAGGSSEPVRGPGIVVREEDVQKIMQERRAATLASQDGGTNPAWAWIVFGLSGAAFAGLTVYLRRSKADGSKVHA